MSLKCWSKSHKLVLPSGKIVRSFQFPNHKQTLHIEVDKDGWWSVTNSPWDIMKEVFYPAHGYDTSRIEAFKEFRKELNSERKRF